MTAKKATTGADIVGAALAATTAQHAHEVQELIAAAIGHRYQRPVGDRWNNVGFLTASGSSYDHKILEIVTNMQDAVVELLALRRYGNDRSKVPYKTPQEAAAALLAHLDAKEQAALASMTLASSGEPGKKRVTAIARDLGCGMTTSAVPRTIFQVGAGHKDGVDWLQGTFGLGGATTYRNARAVVLVTRRHPDLLEAGEEDRITVAVVEWERHKTTENAFYLVTTEWRQAGDVAEPFSVPASEYPEFEPGTHLALVAYATEGLGRRSGDERSFDTILNTRLYRPVMPIRYQNIPVRDRYEYLRGLERRLLDNPGPDDLRGSDVLPFSFDGKTYHLPISFRIFARRGEKGERRNFVAYGHALLLTSNGQVHAHWDPQDFRLRTRLKKLYDRVLVVVESDALPIEIRTSLFTADRSQLVKTDAAIRLEKEIAAFLDDWASLVDVNNRLIREAIEGDSSDRPTIELARKIARALKVKGFALGGAGTRGGGPRPPSPTPPEDLYDDPTHFEGPGEVQAVTGSAKGVYFKLNAKDGFIPRRASVDVSCDHPDIGDDDLTVGSLSGGRLRVSLAVPENADLGMYKLSVVIDGWSKSSGGLGPRFEWVTKVEVIDKAVERKPTGGAGPRTGDKGPGEGDLVALIWKSDEDKDEWDPSTVGDVEMVPAKELAATHPEYAELASIDGDIPTLVLNKTYSHLKPYMQARAEDLTEEGKEQARERYAVGVGVGLLLLHQQQAKDEKAGKKPDDSALRTAQQAAARSVLSVLPEYDKLAKEIDE